MSHTQALEQREETPAAALSKQLQAVKPYLDRLLPDPARFGATLMITARRNPDLLRCDPASVVGAALVCAQLDLEPGASEHVWLIPRYNKNTRTNDCTLLLGYKGMKALTERHPLIASVRTGIVHEGDDFEYSAQPPALTHTPKFTGGAAKLWYAIATRRDTDAPHIIVLDRAAVEARRARSASPNVGPWKDFYDAMAQKSAIRALWKELPSSLDLSRAAQIDDGAGVVRAQDLLIGQPRLIDKATGEIIEEVDGAASGTAPGGATTTVEAEDVAAPSADLSKVGSDARDPKPDATPPVQAATQDVAPSVVRPEAASAPGESEHPGDRASRPAARDVQAPEPSSPAVGAGGGLGAPISPTPTSATDIQCELLQLMASEFRWTDMNSPHWNPRLAEVAIEHFAPLTFDEAAKVIAHYAPRLEEWRLNRRSRLASIASACELDLGALLAERDLDLAGELSAAVAWDLIDELEVKPPAGQSSSEAAGSTPAADLVSFQTLLLALMPGEKRREAWVASVCERAGVAAVEELTADQLAGETVLLRQRAVTR